MDEIILTLPGREHQAQADELKQEHFRAGEEVIHGSALFDKMEYDEWLERTERYRYPEAVDDGWVPATTFFAMRQRDQRLVGMIDVRHNIKHPFLAEYGGHIGYSIRPSERRQGYAVQMLDQALIYARGLGMHKVMLGCYADNKGSAKTIRHLGGVLVEEKPYLDEKPMQIYWINLPVAKKNARFK